MRALLFICMPVVLLAQAQYEESIPFLDDYGVDYLPGNSNSENEDSVPQTYQQQVRIDPVIRPEKTATDLETEPTEPGPLGNDKSRCPLLPPTPGREFSFFASFARVSLPDCREEQYPCTRLYSVHKPCKQCLNSLCFYSLRRVYVINKEVCVRTVCAHEELLRADLCRDQFSRCGVAAVSGHCGSLGGSCGKSCGGGC
ncbi:microfibrillar-associated protein 2 isoform X1 [Syngnathoides biaculeatus]|uniref:microfibrillar-associated protein 2 isoform X1 n=1 Tax=Syngnathoides biaculeatus TaxID=300417 RepID=UPI002ADD6537|nr:microfibrillar-associated protein 2 isoform X1 [Syngnathoides biaculeatus]XP_061688555.1 microfibrillar-associated protein 2 isoform X1 [Syngnathoides biaculeatus]